MLSLVALVAIAASPSEEVAARGVLTRTIGRRAGSFELKLLPKEDVDRFEVSASGGKVTVRGTSGVALCRGAYEYLKDACHCQVTWSADNLELPKVLPNYELRKVTSAAKYRHYFNVCTFGYTTAWWDWKRWQREIDWMALHGINMPLAMNGQEKVWQKVFRDLGVPNESIKKHFSGPAFLPWHRMGNLNSHMGPLPQSWLDGQASLQKQILKRERELGMSPVVPGFSGFVPVDFDKYHPTVKLASPTAWAGFAPTKFVDVRSPMFVEIGRRFVQEYRRQFGSDHLYLCDTFNEQNPQFPEATKLADLKQAGAAVYEALKQADPGAVWVMQGWLFYNAKDYWKAPEVEALLSGVPDGRMIILDLATSEYPVWKHQPSVASKGWILNTLHNYGQTTGLYGPLQSYADTVSEALDSPAKGRMLGMGLTMEGIDQNPVVYELMTDLMWPEPRRQTVEAWLEGYVASRYGSGSSGSMEAWKILHKLLYSKGSPWYRAAWRGRPGGAAGSLYDPEKLEEAVRLLLLDAANLGTKETYRRDLVDVTKTWLSALTDNYLGSAIYRNSLEDRKTFLGLLEDLDKLLATRPEHRLSTWIEGARDWGKTRKERDHMEANARMQVTTWGGPVLFDYANKEWAGIVADFNVPRWRMYFGEPKPDFAKWETDWALSTRKPRESRPGDEIEVARALFEKYSPLESSLAKLVGVSEDPGIAVGKPVRDSGGTEPGGDPAQAVDGNVFGGFWSASPAPQWIEVDLESVREVTGIHLFPYCRDSRYYQYTVEVSLDGQAWTRVADGSANTVPASIKGYRHDWAPLSARFVRVNMVRNSANVGVHLHELRVYGKER